MCGRTILMSCSWVLGETTAQKETRESLLRFRLTYTIRTRETSSTSGLVITWTMAGLFNSATFTNQAFIACMRRRLPGNSHVWEILHKLEARMRFGNGNTGPT